MICAIKIVISIKITQIEVQSDEVTFTLLYIYSIGQKTCAEAKIFIATSNSCSYVNKGRIYIKFCHFLHRVRTEGGEAKRNSFVVPSDSFTPLKILLISSNHLFLENGA
jgi:hypothetical protein